MHPHINHKYTEDIPAFLYFDWTKSILVIAPRDWWDCLRTFHRRWLSLRLRLFLPLPKYQISSVSHLPIWNISFLGDLADTYGIIHMFFPSSHGKVKFSFQIKRSSLCAKSRKDRKFNKCSSVQRPAGIYLEEQTQPFQREGWLRKMTISSEENYTAPPTSFSPGKKINFQLFRQIMRRNFSI